MAVVNGVAQGSGAVVAAWSAWRGARNNNTEVEETDKDVKEDDKEVEKEAEKEPVGPEADGQTDDRTNYQAKL